MRSGPSLSARDLCPAESCKQALISYLYVTFADVLGKSLSPL